MSFGSDATVLRRQALGRHVSLGALYDARHDSIVRAGPGFFDSFPESARTLVKDLTLKAKFMTEDSFTSRCDLLDVEPFLRINVILSNFDAYGDFLLRHSESHKSVSASLAVFFQTATETLSLDDKNLRNFLIQEALRNGQATHVIVGVNWGANAVVEFSTTTHSVTAAKSTREMLGEALASIAHSINKDKRPTVMNNAFFQTFEFTVCGDIVPPNGQPRTINEVLLFLSQVPNLALKADNGKGKPVSYDLFPLYLLQRKQRALISDSFQSRDSEMVTRITELYDKLQDEEKTLIDNLVEREGFSGLVTREVKDRISVWKKSRAAEMMLFREELQSGLNKGIDVLSKLLEKWSPSSGRSLPQKSEGTVKKYLSRESIASLPASASETISRASLSGRPGLYTPPETFSGISDVPPRLLPAPAVSRSTQPDSRLCQDCEEDGDKTLAEFFCSDCSVKKYYCFDCLEHVHKKPKRRHHKYQKLIVDYLINSRDLQNASENIFKFKPRERALNVLDAEFIEKLFPSALPWKAEVPGLFQLLKVVFDDTDSSVSEKVVIAEEELSNLCNTFISKSCFPNCSKIDFDALKCCSVIPIGLAGDNRAIYGFLQNHLHLNRSIDYDKMVNPKFCPSGLYALMPNKTSLFMFYWQSGSYSPEIESKSITCQMLRHLRDFCIEIILCFDEKTFMNLKLPRPEKKDHLSHRDVKIQCEITEHCATPSKGFVEYFEGTSKSVPIR